ncbi:MAG: hypothetical protein HYW02_03015 [Deltaproteobacteria bacterium]|nr:hypothetical protein [Deltaproteobacteria bacterium]MBI2500440.1 hypothetical protein [Deltaproteobacteria bacterium]
MVGMITERDWREIERQFPGLHSFYGHLPRKPHTFLELLELFRIYKQFTTRRRSMSDSPLGQATS